MAKFDSLKPQPLPTVMAAGDTGRNAPPTFRLAGGSFKHPAEKVEPGFPLFLGASRAKHHSAAGRISVHRPPHGLGQLAHAPRPSDDGPHHGQPALGESFRPRDRRHAQRFRRQGEPPTHPELLDWLAVELMDSGWSLKSIHRLMVTSATYRQAALVDAKNAAHAKALIGDPTDNLLWHFRRQRLTARRLRDAVLQVSGDLNLRMYGPSAHPELPDGLGNYAWKPDAQAEDRNRRSIYVLAKRNLRLPLLDAFDLPDMHNSCAAPQHHDHRAASPRDAQQRLHASGKRDGGAVG